MQQENASMDAAVSLAENALRYCPSLGSAHEILGRVALLRASGVGGAATAALLDSQAEFSAGITGPFTLCLKGLGGIAVYRLHPGAVGAGRPPGSVDANRVPH